LVGVVVEVEVRVEVVVVVEVVDTQIGGRRWA